MQVRARAMLRVAQILEALSEDDRRAVVYEAYRSYGGPLTPAERTARWRAGLRDENVTMSVTKTSPPASPLCQNVHENGDGQHVVGSSSSTNGSHYSEEAKDILRFLNEKTGRSYRAGDINLGFIVQRLKSGATVEDCKGVIARKTRQWRGGEMEKYLRPATLFNATKFEQYVGEQSNA